MKKVVVYGNTTLSKMLFYDAVGSVDFEIVCFTVDKEYLQNTELLGLPQLDFAKIEKTYPPDEYDMIAVLSGYRCMRDREKMFLKAKGKGYYLRNYVSPKADFSPTINLGENNIVMAQSHIGIGGSMGNNNIIRQNAYLGHDFHLGNNNFIGPGCSIGGNCMIGNTCFIGLGATITNNITIEDETLIGAGSVVIRNTEPFSKNVGNPAKIIGYHKEEGIRMDTDRG
jgi:sugar O-acyltransferase (sialic acid O-acetyltransferase NeuD family)